MNSDFGKEQGQQLECVIDTAYNFIAKNYTKDLPSTAIVPCADFSPQCKSGNKVILTDDHLSGFRVWKIESLAFMQDDRHVLDRFANIYSSLAESGCTLAYIIHVDKEQCDVYLGVKYGGSTGKVDLLANAGMKTLKKAVEGNLPGSRMSEVVDRDKFVSSIFSNRYNVINIACVSGVPGVKGDDRDGASQGMEYLVDALREESFTMIGIAEPVSRVGLNEIRRGYEDVATEISPLATTDLSIGETEGKAFCDGQVRAIANSVMENYSNTLTENSGTTDSSVRRRNLVVSAWTELFGGKTGGSTAVQTGRGHATQNGGGKGRVMTNSRQINKTLSQGKSRSIQVKYQNKTIQALLQRIDVALERIKECEDSGAWMVSTYFVSADKLTTVRAAQTYKGLMAGRNSSNDPLSVSVWDANNGNLDDLKKSIMRFEHPKFSTTPNAVIPNTRSFGASSIVSGKEVSLLFGLPRRSVLGLPVSDCVSFAREVTRTRKSEGRVRKYTPVSDIVLGRIFHMGNEGQSCVPLTVQELTGHVLVTGAPGSGKSNTVYHLLNELSSRKVAGGTGNIKFLIVEPAKGEYKNVFGGRNDVRVFSTDRTMSEFFSINPFVVRNGCQIGVHINRLVDIFNACWSMYAAMPSILKRAIVRCYEDCGWDIDRSVCYEKRVSFPTFNDLLDALPEVLNESGFSGEVKDNYTAALVERVKDLTEGFEREIFSADSIEDNVLFSENCILDLSQGLSDDTRSLIMGFLIVKMEEYYKSRRHDGEMNLPLRHVTVLEEAHNLLRKTTFAQTSEGANVQGKSVEMITNAIKVMRSDGECFIIADQCPTSLDESVSSCTSTKIIHRLPNVSDYSFIGNSISLNESQKAYLSRLKTGVAAVHSGDWESPVLCSVQEFHVDSYVPYKKEDNGARMQDDRVVLGALVVFLLTTRAGVDIGKHSSIYSQETLNKITSFVGKLGVESADVIKKNISSYMHDGLAPIWKDEASIVRVIGTLAPWREILKLRYMSKGIGVAIAKMRIRLHRFICLDACPQVENWLLCLMLQWRYADAIKDCVPIVEELKKTL